MTASLSKSRRAPEYEIRNYGSLIVEAYEYWLEYFGPSAKKDPSLFNPLFDKPHLMNSLGFLAVSHDPLNIVYRFIGPVVLGIVKRDFTGQSIFKGTYSAFPQIARDHYIECAMTGEPQFSQNALLDYHGSNRRIDRVFLPIPGEDGRVSTIIGVIQPHSDIGMDFIQRFMLANDL